MSVLDESHATRAIETRVMNNMDGRIECLLGSWTKPTRGTIEMPWVTIAAKHANQPCAIFLLPSLCCVHARG